MCCRNVLDDGWSHNERRPRFGIGERSGMWCQHCVPRDASHADDTAHIRKEPVVRPPCAVTVVPSLALFSFFFFPLIFSSSAAAPVADAHAFTLAVTWKAKSPGRASSQQWDPFVFSFFFHSILGIAYGQPKRDCMSPHYYLLLFSHVSADICWNGNLS